MLEITGATMIIVVSVLIQTIGFVVWITKLGQKVEDLRKKSDNYDKLGERIAKLEGRMEPYVKRKSPMSLTERGEKFLEVSGAKEYIQNNLENLISKFETIEAPLDIQEKAKQVMAEKLRENNDIKAYVFREGEDMDNLAVVAGIELRDLVIKHKGIEI